VYYLFRYKNIVIQVLSLLLVYIKAVPTWLSAEKG
jgi:hypothetical protein